MQEISPDELAKCSGENGAPAYIVHQGNVFDVTESKLWQGGGHMRRHRAGKDLTAEIQAAPHGTEVLERYPQVGVLEKESAPVQAMPKIFSRLLARFPLLRRHPHPMTVHFPIVFMFSATTFTLLYLLTGRGSFESTALNCLGAGIIFTPVAMATGHLTWWLNYQARPMRPVAIKRRLSMTLFLLEIILFAWRMAVPDILDSFGLPGAVHLALVLFLFPLVAVIGWFGASLTFPVGRE
jgi:predicted heme/steroid binding protein/uncharacterized membrane protein